MQSGVPITKTINTTTTTTTTTAPEWGELLESKQDIVVHGSTNSSCGSLALYVVICAQTPDYSGGQVGVEQIHLVFEAWRGRGGPEERSVCWCKQGFLSQGCQEH
ncbi:hypothetical protein NQZ68_025826 [Dissostichus eleginoides]|nr:hypothetical protein NQZ68_025826 [Dissostichus eleginoides]